MIRRCYGTAAVFEIWRNGESIEISRRNDVGENCPKEEFILNRDSVYVVLWSESIVLTDISLPFKFNVNENSLFDIFVWHGGHTLNLLSIAQSQIQCHKQTVELIWQESAEFSSIFNNRLRYDKIDMSENQLYPTVFILKEIDNFAFMQ